MGACCRSGRCGGTPGAAAAAASARHAWLRGRPSLAALAALLVLVAAPLGAAQVGVAMRVAGGASEAVWHSCVHRPRCLHVQRMRTWRLVSIWHAA